MDIESFNIELGPEGLLEQILADEIIGAASRLRRCAAAEAEAGDTDERIERIRAQAHSILHRSINQFRRLQTERACRQVLNAVGDDGGITDYKEVTAAANNYERLKQRYRENKLASICEIPGHAPESALASNCETGHSAKAESASNCKTGHSAKAELASNCKTGNAAKAASLQTPRNAPCPCNSGEKYKRCCGRNAPPVLSRAA